METDRQSVGVVIIDWCVFVAIVLATPVLFMCGFTFVALLTLSRCNVRVGEDAALMLGTAAFAAVMVPLVILEHRGKRISRWSNGFAKMVTRTGTKRG